MRDNPAEKTAMPIHDWSCVDHGVFHDFHQAWTIEIRNALKDDVEKAGSERAS